MVVFLMRIFLNCSASSPKQRFLQQLSCTVQRGFAQQARYLAYLLHNAIDVPPDSGVVGLSVEMHVVPIPGVAFSDCVVLGDDLADGEVDGAPVVPSYLLN